MTKGITFNFPLCLLSYLNNKNDRLEHIISYCIVEYALKLQNIEFSDYINEEFIMENELENILENEENIPEDYDSDDELEGMILVSAERKGIVMGGLESTKIKHKKTHKFVDKYQSIYGKDAFVQVNKNLCFDVRDGIFDYNLFALICAVKSVIGKNSKYKRITKAQIRHRMNGFKSQNIMEDRLRLPIADMSPNIISLNDKKIERLRDKAEQLGFFNTHTYKRRQTFYSTRLDKKELIKAVFKSKDYAFKRKVDGLEAELEAKHKQKELRGKRDSLNRMLQEIRV